MGRIVPVRDITEPSPARGDSQTFVASQDGGAEIENKWAKDELRLLQRALSASQQGVMITDATEPDDPIIYVNRAFERITGYSTDEVVGRNPRFLQAGDDQPAIRELRKLREERGDEVRWSGILRNYKKDGAMFWNELGVAAMNGGGRRVTNHVGTVNDVTERKRLEEEFAHRAFHDPLTGLANRTLLMGRLEHALARSARGEVRVAVLFLDLDLFKHVNDSFGHETGDRLLVEVARRLKECVRPGDTVARLGGDEFVVLLEDVTDEGEAIHVAERVAEALRPSFALVGHEVHVTASVGIALNRTPRDRPGELLRNADAAMYRAKEHGKARYVLFEEEMNVRALRRLALEGDLRRAMESPSEEFVVHYQPKADLSTGRLVCVEALVRWRHPERGLLLPEDFVRVAEETGLVVPLGRW